MKRIVADGNYMASNIAYMFNDVAVIYPITPSSPMAENADQFAYDGKLNLFGNKLTITQMQSEAGVAGALHGSLLTGAKTTTFTSSQGLLLMVPNMYKIAGEGLSSVFYVSARSVATHALNIFCDYSDIYACLKTGFNMVSCSSVQEVNDMAIACELASLKSKIPYICFFDGFRTSHELNTVEMTELDDLHKIVTPADFMEFRARGINNFNPVVHGTNQNPDVFMQNRIASVSRYINAISDFRTALTRQERITGRHYDTIEYYGSPRARDVVVAMGSVTDTLIDACKQDKNRVGVIKVRMLKPFDDKRFLELLPKTTKNITILERNLDANGVDTLTSFVENALFKAKRILNTYSGTFGLGGKEFTPDMAMSVFENMRTRKKDHFSVGVYDDLTHTNIETKEYNLPDPSEFALRAYGFGSDGSVSSIKNTIKIIGEKTNNYVQGYFDYDSKKSGSLTVSNMRVSSTPILAPYNPRKVNFVMCNNQNYIEKYDLTECLVDTGVLLLNSSLTIDELNEKMPNKLKRDIIEKRIRLYSIDADKIARDNNLGGKINTVMQTAFFSISKVLPFDVAMDSIKTFIIKSYSKKGQEIVDNNLKAIENIEKKITRIDNKNIIVNVVGSTRLSHGAYYDEIISPIALQQGDTIPVSKFDAYGRMPTNTAKFEKRGIASNLPNWIAEKCIQCGRCSAVCPHAAIRPVVFRDGKRVPKTFTSRKQFLGDGNYRVQVSTLDCTGCGVCASVCPVRAIMMTEADKIKGQESINYQFSETLPEDKTPIEVKTCKEVQFKKPYFEFSGACAGCGETPYIKMVSQLFGDRMLIANATGCSSIYGGTFPTCPYARDKEGYGPSWANSLFEDNAEFGYGMAISRRALRNTFIENLKTRKFSKKISSLIAPFLDNPENHEYNKQLILELNKYKKGHILNNDDIYIFDNLALITSPSVWIIGGDGWAYDIGFGGLDHVVASGENVNILILDTEVYSNTGGQTSKSTPRGATAKFNISGKTTKKKDLASILMTYKDVYVATVSMGANPDQCVQAMVEAERYNGPSVIIAYAPCVNHGYSMDKAQLHADASVKSGYNTLFRYNPNSKDQMVVDSYEPIMEYKNFVMTENRFAILDKVNKPNKNKLLKQSEYDAKSRRETYLDKAKKK